MNVELYFYLPDGKLYDSYLFGSPLECPGTFSYTIYNWLKLHPNGKVEIKCQN